MCFLSLICHKNCNMQISIKKIQILNDSIFRMTHISSYLLKYFGIILKQHFILLTLMTWMNVCKHFFLGVILISQRSLSSELWYLIISQPLSVDRHFNLVLLFYISLVSHFPNWTFLNPQAEPISFVVSTFHRHPVKLLYMICVS